MLIRSFRDLMPVRTTDFHGQRQRGYQRPSGGKGASAQRGDFGIAAVVRTDLGTRVDMHKNSIRFDISIQVLGQNVSHTTAKENLTAP